MQNLLYFKAYTYESTICSCYNSMLKALAMLVTASSLLLIIAPKVLVRRRVRRRLRRPRRAAWRLRRSRGAAWAAGRAGRVVAAATSAVALHGCSEKKKKGELRDGSSKLAR